MKFSAQKLPITNEIAPNTILVLDNFHLSYNRNSSGYGTDTTAIVLKNHVFFVLAGNHKRKLEEHARLGVQGCMEYFIQNINLALSKVEHEMALGLREDEYNLKSITLEVLGESCFQRVKESVRFS